MSDILKVFSGGLDLGGDGRQSPYQDPRELLRAKMEMLKGCAHSGILRHEHLLGLKALVQDLADQVGDGSDYTEDRQP